MRTARSSSRHVGFPHPTTPQSRHPPGPGTPSPSEQAPPEQVPPLEQTPLGAGNSPEQAPPWLDPPQLPLGCGPGPDPPQLPCWLWAWTRSPSTSPLGVGLETCKVCWDTTLKPPETCCKACWDTTCNACWDSTPPPWTEFYYLAETLFVGGNNRLVPPGVRDP